jgi:uncharacterized protein YjbJ (UPF0337 family)
MYPRGKETERRRRTDRGGSSEGCVPATSGKLSERRKHMGLLGGSSGKDDKDKGAMDRAKGRMKEAGGALTGEKGKKREGRSDQRKGKVKEKKGDLKDLLS